LLFQESAGRTKRKLLIKKKRRALSKTLRKADTKRAPEKRWHISLYEGAKKEPRESAGPATRLKKLGGREKGIHGGGGPLRDFKNISIPILQGP